MSNRHRRVLWGSRCKEEAWRWGTHLLVSLCTAWLRTVPGLGSSPGYRWAQPHYAERLYRPGSSGKKRRAQADTFMWLLRKTLWVNQEKPDRRGWALWMREPRITGLAIWTWPHLHPQDRKAKGTGSSDHRYLPSWLTTATLSLWRVTPQSSSSRAGPG